MDFKTRQQTIKNILTCRICGKLAREITQIEECCHTFCRKCIIKKFSEENLSKCPRCDVDLGAAPLQKIKADYTLQVIRDKYTDMRRKVTDYGMMKSKGKYHHIPTNLATNKAEAVDQKGNGKEYGASNQATDDQETQVFGRRRGKGRLIIYETSEEALETHQIQTSSASISSFPRKKKQRSLSSLVNGNGLSFQTAPRGRRRRSTGRKSAPPPSASFAGLQPFEMDDDDHDDQEHFRSSSIIPLTISKNPSSAHDEPFEKQKPDKDSSEALERMDESMNPLLQLVEGAAKSMMLENHKVVEQLESNGKGDPASEASAPFKPKRGRPRKDEKRVLPDHQDRNNVKPEKKRILTEDLNIPTHLVIGPAAVFNRTSPVWFQLVASDKQESSGILPSIPPCYLQVKDGNMRASFIKKYLVVKLGLETEDEVEIRMRGELVHPDMGLQELKELWVKKAKRRERKKLAVVGSSAEDFMIIFSYSWSTC